ncbi:MAG: ATP-binding protein [Oceanospirillaceae bacterium]
MNSSTIKWYLLAIIFAVVLTVYYFISLLDEKQQNALQSASSDVRTTLEKRLNNDLDYIKLLAEMRIRGELTPATFTGRTQDFLIAHQELINFTWVDNNFDIKGVSPLKGNEQIIGLHLGLPEPARVSLLAKNTKKAQYTEAFEALQGDCSFEVWYPVYKDEQFLGLFAGVYSCEKLLKSTLLESVTQQYLVSLTDNKSTFLAEVNYSEGIRTDDQKVIDLELGNNLLLSMTRVRQPLADFNLYILAFIVVVLIFLALYNAIKIRTNVKNRLTLLDNLEKANLSLQESDKRFKLIFQSSPIGMILLNNKGQIIGINPLICDLFGYDESQLIQQKIEHLIPKQAQNNIRWVAVQSEQDVNAIQGTVLDEQLGYKYSGESVPLQIALAPMTLNGQHHTLVSVIDNTERKGLVDELKIQNDKLNRSNQKLVQSNEQLERFAYICSHDLQEPVRMVQSFGPLLEERLEHTLGNKLDQKSSEYLSYMIGGANRARDMIDDILQYCRNDQPITNFESVSLSNVCKEVRTTLTQQLSESQGELIWQDDLPSIMAVPSQVFQLFLNLISNGLKFNTSEKPLVEISVTSDEHVWRINVIDNGIGIAPQYQQKIFTIFERLHGNSEYPGTGIGLASCLRITERHNATINIISELDKGSNFYICWPKN